MPFDDLDGPDFPSISKLIAEMKQVLSESVPKVNNPDVQALLSQLASDFNLQADEFMVVAPTAFQELESTKRSLFNDLVQQQQMLDAEGQRAAEIVAQQLSSAEAVSSPTGPNMTSEPKPRVVAPNLGTALRNGLLEHYFPNTPASAEGASSNPQMFQDWVDSLVSLNVQVTSKPDPTGTPGTQETPENTSIGFNTWISESDPRDDTDSDAADRDKRSEYRRYFEGS